MEELNNKRLREETEEIESEVDFPEVKRLREDLLESLDEETDFCPSSQDLDSFMKSFEEEITASPKVEVEVEEVVDLTSDSGESQPELGYLLEASDDELGLPPSSASPSGVENEQRNELLQFESDSSELSSEFSWLDGEIPSFDSFELGFVDTENHSGNNGEYVALDGLFDNSGMGFGSNDFAWRPETSLPAQI
ncbi:uncharacterized protein LOC111403200 [Olea europaea var. sylvestris]|uniref:Uncharacterized protein n=1 Tax=Olea europaea subsp. europaea TaxID=158383 RepID=A0A8S0QDF7_OLEEU|nr:uncharacterized protein LOC111403200 [Olea europaea var. sylvestris]CAA2964634.1 Hypothetical predicted protein [Olea europaea subsp. europaea]